MSTAIRVSIMDAHPAIREALTAFIESSARFMLAQPAAEMSLETIHDVARVQPDVILLGRSSRYALAGFIHELRGLLPAVKIIVLTSFNQDDSVPGDVQFAGADAVLRKNTPPEVLAQTIVEVCE